MTSTWPFSAGNGSLKTTSRFGRRRRIRPSSRRPTQPSNGVAESEDLDMVFQDVVWASKSIDITDQVLKILGDNK